MFFTHKYWNELCLFFLDRSNVLSVEQYLKNPNHNTPIILKHDVEYDIDLAIKIGEVESNLGINSTFYLQFDVAISNPDKIIKLKDMGHDIGYHYDVLDANNGDYKAAINQFRLHLDAFSDMGIDIKTVCPHGNPIKMRSGWTSNKDFFRSSKVRRVFPDIIDIVVDREKIFPEELWYISDAGYSFKLIGDISNNDRIATLDKNIVMPDDLPTKKCTILVSTHPHRWMKSKYKFYMKKTVFIISKILGKSLSRVTFLKPIFNSLYHLARRF